MRLRPLLWLAAGLFMYSAATTQAAETKPANAPATPAAQTRSLKVLSPKDGEVIQGTTVVIRVELQNLVNLPAPVPADAQNIGKHPQLNKPGEGHMHLKLDVMPVVVWDDNSTTYTLTNVPPGEHELEINFSHNDHIPYDPQISQTIRFRTAMPLPATGVTQPQSGQAALSVFVMFALLSIISGALLVRWSNARRFTA